MELSVTRDATGCATTRELPKLLWNPKVHYRIHKSSPRALVMSYTKPVNTTDYISPRAILILSTHLCLGLPSGLFPSASPTNNQYEFLPSHPLRLGHSNYNWRGLEITKLFVMQFSPLSRHFIPLRPKYPPQITVLNTLSLRSPLMS
jgi:hypothetical protein